MEESANLYVIIQVMLQLTLILFFVQTKHKLDSDYFLLM